MAPFDTKYSEGIPQTLNVTNMNVSETSNLNDTNIAANKTLNVNGSFSFSSGNVTLTSLSTVPTWIAVASMQIMANFIEYPLFVARMLLTKAKFTFSSQSFRFENLATGSTNGTVMMELDSNGATFSVPILNNGQMLITANEGDALNSSHIRLNTGSQILCDCDDFKVNDQTGMTTKFQVDANNDAYVGTHKVLAYNGTPTNNQIAVYDEENAQFVLGRRGPSYYFQGRTPTALTTRTGVNTGEYKDLGSLTNQVIRSHTSIFDTSTGVFTSPINGVYSFQYHVTFSAAGADTITNANVTLQKYSGGIWNRVCETSHYPGSPDDIGEITCNGTSMQSLIAGEQMKVVTYIAWSNSSATMRYMNGTGFSGISLF